MQIDYLESVCVGRRYGHLVLPDDRDRALLTHFSRLSVLPGYAFICTILLRSFLMFCKDL